LKVLKIEGIEALSKMPYTGKRLIWLSPNFGGTQMKRIIVSLAIVLTIVLMTLSLQGCASSSASGRSEYPGAPGSFGPSW
jgi:hypothetical protein